MLRWLYLSVICVESHFFSSAPISLRTEQQPAQTIALACPQTPRLSWVNPLPSNIDEQNITQVSYSVEVYSGKVVQASALVWNSSVISSEQTVIVNTSLPYESNYCWRVQVVLSTSSQPSPWTDVLVFRTGIDPASWTQRNVSWIGGFNQLRGAMSVPGQEAIQEAYLTVTGVGAYYIYINGDRVGDHIMSPAQTVYPKRILYEVFDVTKYMQLGLNLIGAMLGNVKFGYTDIWCNMTEANGPSGCQALLLQLVVIQEGGRRWGFVSKESNWQGRQGPVVWDHLFHGETYDARLDLPDWTINYGEDNGWSSVVVMNPPGTGLASFEHITPALLPPIRVTKDYTPINIYRQPSSITTTTTTTAAADSWIFDFGQNMAGFVTLSLPGGQNAVAPGTQIRVEHAEILTQTNDLQNTYCTPNPHLKDLRHEPCFPHQTFGNGHDIADRYIGDFNNANMTNIYIANGTASGETYTPLFSYAGFRFVRLSNLSFVPDKTTLTAHFAHTDVEKVGNFFVAPVSAMGVKSFRTPDVLNRIHSLAQFSQLSNLWSIPTDCPQRERRGWTGDSQVSSGEAILNFDMQTFYEKFLRDMRDDQLWGCASTPGAPCSDPIGGNGSIADVVPFDGIGGWPGCPVWQVAYIVIARQYWKYYGDVTLLQEHYPGLVDLMGYFLRAADPSDGLLVTQCYGDWVDTGYPWDDTPPTPPASVTAFYFVLGLRYMSEIATALQLSDDAAKYTELHSLGLLAYHKRFYNDTISGYSPNKHAPFGSQCSNAMALELGAPPSPDIAKKVGDMLRADVAQQSNHSSGGIVGMVWTFPALAHAGFGDYALSILRQDTAPSFGRMLQQNFTTLCERWGCTATSDGGGSMNHIMFGAFDAWMMTAIGGLDTISNSSTTGWRVIKVAPLAEAIQTLGYGGMSVNTRFGLAGVSWRLDHNALSMNLTVPVGSQAEVHLPETLADLRIVSPVLINGLKTFGVPRLESSQPVRYVVVPSGIFSIEAQYQ